jgi:tyrosyl-tRNA synthetase
VELLEEHLRAFRRGAVDLIDEPTLRHRVAASLSGRKPMRIKFGMDPSSPDLHLGHAVVLHKLRALQQLGHRVVLIVGDATAMVGDPSGRNKLRPQLSRAEVEANLRTYTDQAGRVLDMRAAEVHRNSEWFDAMRFEDILRLSGRMTVARMLERDTFQGRIQEGEPIGVHELLYPLMQGWDSVMIRADVELGGSDQLFNLLVGRTLQEQEGQPPQVCLTTPLINGLDGRKMSKSYGNSIGLTDAPAEMYGRIMSLSDEVMPSWLELLTDLGETERKALLSGHPRDAKARLASIITGFFCGESAALEAAAEFDRRFRDGLPPSEIPELPWPGPPDGALPLALLLREIKLVPSAAEARRLVQQGGVRINQRAASDPMQSIDPSDLPLEIQVGKRRFARVLRP